MKKVFLKIYLLLLVAVLLPLPLLSSCNDRRGEGEYTYRTYTTTLGTDWNPHTWQTNYDNSILGYLTSPFVDMAVLDSEKGIYQWVFEMATSIEDVTADNQADLLKYGSSLPEGVDYSKVTSGYVYEIKLNKDAKWENGVPISADDYIYSMKMLLSPEMKNYRANLYISGESALAGAYEYYYMEGVPTEEDFERVGLYKVDDYTIRYVTKSYIDKDYFYSACSKTWLVYRDLYEAGFDRSGKLLTTNYGTSKETTMSYGVYKLESLQKEKQISFVRNENWYGFEKDENGRLVSYADFEVDGEYGKEQYKTTRVVIDVMDNSSAKQAFLKGNLSTWTPNADELSNYSSSDKLYRVDQTYTWSFFFNSDYEALLKMDKSFGNENSVVLSSYSFRKALSLAINRSEFATATPGYKPAFEIMNRLYHYNAFQDPESVYRDSEAAMQAMCGLYGVKYGTGTPYPTLRDAYESITGYNLKEAKRLMTTAFSELSEAGIYREGERIRINIAWSGGALTNDDNKQLTLLNRMVNEAALGSGFGEIEFVAQGNVASRHGKVAGGEYAMGYGAWGGAAFYPFRNFQVYMDPSQYNIHEAGCWDPTKEKLTLEVGGESVTMTYQEWSQSLVGTGVYASSDFETRLGITAMLEEAFLSKFYRIPIASSTECFLLSHQIEYYTDLYNVMYEFGGERFLQYGMDDYGWSLYVRENGGRLNYE